MYIYLYCHNTQDSFLYLTFRQHVEAELVLVCMSTTEQLPELLFIFVREQLVSMRVRVL